MDAQPAVTARPVIAAVDGGEHGERALRFAIDEAGRRHTGLRVVHAAVNFVPYAGPTPLLPGPTLHEIGAQILKDAFDHCQELAPDLAVEGTLVIAHPVEALVEASHRASVVVLGTRARHGLRAFGGATAAGVGALAHCTVVAVPPSWHPGVLHGRVVVGLDAHGGPEAVLRRGFEEASLRRAELSVVHSWSTPEGYTNLLPSLDAEEWQRLATSAIEESVRPWQDKHPEVAVRLQISYGSASRTLKAQSQEADLVVLGRHRGSIPSIHRLGSVTHRVLQSGVAPLEIVPVGTTRGL